MKTKKLTLCFLILGIMLVSLGMVSAAHTSTATVSPSGWLKKDTVLNLVFNVSNTGGDSILYVIIQKPAEFSTLVGNCSALAGWDVTENPTFCTYYAGTGHEIESGKSQTFNINSTTSTFGTYSWSVKTNDGIQQKTNSVSVQVQTVQNAIDTATASSTINVPAGTYVESVNVNKNVIINGSGVDSTIIAPGAGNYGFKITADGVKINNLRIQTQFVLNDQDDTGIMIMNADNVEISNNKIISTSGTATNGTEGSIGIWVCGTGSGCSDSDNLVIKKNTITINGVSTGIYVEQANPSHNGWIIGGSSADKNIITANNGNPLELYDVSDSEVSYNNLTTSSSGGSNVIWSSELSNITNLVFKNNTIDGSKGSQVAFLADFIGIGANTNVTTVTITGNTFSNWDTKALRIGARVTGVVAHYNKLLRNAQVLTLLNEDTSSINAENNWWGTANKNTISTLVSGNVDYTPWWYDATGSASDTILPVVTFTQTPYSNELGVVSKINFTIADDSGIDKYEISWGDGVTDTPVDGAGNTLVNTSATHTYGSLPITGKYNVTITANDSMSNVKITSIEIAIYEKPSWIIQLNSGSNFVAIPFSSKDDDADGDVDYKDVLEKVRPNLDRVWAYTYDETTKTNMWHYRKTTTTGSWSTMGDLQEIVPGRGYIVFMKNSDTLYGKAKTISGDSNNEPVVPASVKLANGYNLIGVFGNVSNTQAISLSSLKSDTTTYWHKVLDKNEAEVTGNLEPNKAYWISMKHLPDTATQDYYTYYP